MERLHALSDKRGFTDLSDEKTLLRAGAALLAALQWSRSVRSANAPPSVGGGVQPGVTYPGSTYDDYTSLLN